MDATAQTIIAMLRCEDRREDCLQIEAVVRHMGRAASMALARQARSPQHYLTMARREIPREFHHQVFLSSERTTPAAPTLPRAWGRRVDSITEGPYVPRSQPTQPKPEPKQPAKTKRKSREALPSPLSKAELKEEAARVRRLLDEKRRREAERALAEERPSEDGQKRSTS
jgi:hypothetical protein